MRGNILKYVKSRTKYVLPILISGSIAFWAGYHISQKQEHDKHSLDNIIIAVTDYGRYTRFSVEGTFANQSFSIPNLQRFAPNQEWIKFGADYNVLRDIIKNDIMKTYEDNGSENLNVKASRYVHPTDNLLETKIKIMLDYTE